jgi:predicted type IV restriction endonuclease
MQRLNLPEYPLKIKNKNGKCMVFDVIRKKYVILTPEEWVRQHFIHFLVGEKKYPQALIAVEKQLTENGMFRRFDLLAYNRKGEPFLIAEFKAPGVNITQKTFDQAVRYNMSLKVRYIVVSNGLQHCACEIFYEKNSFTFLQEIPEFI